MVGVSQCSRRGRVEKSDDRGGRPCRRARPAAQARRPATRSCPTSTVASPSDRPTPYMAWPSLHILEWEEPLITHESRCVMPPSDSSPSARRDGSNSSPGHSAPGDETWLSTAELAARLKIPVKTLAAWAGSGRGPRYARMGRYRRYRLGDVRAWEDERFAHGNGRS
ncbi:helix-turn-helix domain-containing protein [Nocardia asteroides]|uniref:helix-turn-helix domain-containing protein n=1 Tax=Nocardia asteroides TaxID=1824 RepID=UPI002FCDE8DD